MRWLRRLWWWIFRRKPSANIVLKNGASVRIPYEYFEKGGKVTIETCGAGGGAGGAGGGGGGGEGTNIKADSP